MNELPRGFHIIILTNIEKQNFTKNYSYYQYKVGWPV